MSYIANAAVFVYALSIPSARWLAADRDKFFWSSMILMFGLLSFVGVIVDIVFLVGVVRGCRPAPRRRDGGRDRPRPAANPFLRTERRLPMPYNPLTVTHPDETPSFAYPSITIEKTLVTDERDGDIIGPIMRTPPPSCNSTTSARR